MPKNVKMVKYDPQNKSVRKRGDEDISIGFKGANGNNIEVRKKCDQKEEKREKDDFGPPKR